MSELIPTSKQILQAVDNVLIMYEEDELKHFLEYYGLEISWSNDEEFITRFKDTEQSNHVYYHLVVLKRFYETNNRYLK